MKIVITDAMTVSQGDIDLSCLNTFGEVTVYPLTAPEEIKDRIKDADIVICNKTRLEEKDLIFAKNLKLICLFATGYNNIDTAYCTKAGITVCNAGSYSTNAVAQHTFALILHYYSNVAKYDTFVKDGGWCHSETFSPMVFPMDEITGKTLGVIGYGSIAQKVTEIALAFGMNVLVYTRTKKDDNRVKFVSFDELLANSDIVSVHCPLTDKTEKMFGYNQFCKFKNSALFVNTARGPIVDEVGLVKALNENKLAYACVDVVESEPMKEDCPLRTCDKISITPHVAWAPVSTRVRVVNIVKTNIENYLAGNPTNKVN